MYKLCAEHHKQDTDCCELEYHLGEVTYHLEQLIKSLKEVSIEIKACCNHLREVSHVS